MKSVQELEQIKSHHIKNHIIAIDDAHMLGIQQLDSNGNIICDYTDVPFEKVTKYIMNINSNYVVGIFNPRVNGDMIGQMVLAIVKE